MPGVSSSNSAAAASFDLPTPAIGTERGAGPKRATVGFLTSPNSGSLSLLATTSVVAGAAGGVAVGAAVPAAEPAPAPDPAAAEAAPAPDPAAAEPAAGAAEPAAG